MRDDPAYGPRACNPQEDESFRAGRMAWFERVTGESMEGCDLTQQWQRADRVARAFRADTHGSAANAGASIAMACELCVQWMGC
eukprot:1634197-Prymnesium_polylepis.1